MPLFSFSAGSPVGAPPDPLALVHPELRNGLAALVARDPEMPGGPTHRITPEELTCLLPGLREAWKPDMSHVPMAVRGVPVSEQVITGSRGEPDVHVFMVGAPSDEPRPAILHMHGGGFIVSRARDFVPALQAQALALNCLIVTVDYRLAPETPFPGALEDNYAALRWLYASAAALGVDPTRIAIQGESAGGGHAAMLSIAARDRREVPLLFQCLTYPMLDDRTGSSRHVPPHIGTYCWTPRYNRMAWSALLGVPAGSLDVPAGSVPARTENLSGLPPTFIWVGSLDLFIDEDLEYSRRLVSAGVPGRTSCRSGRLPRVRRRRAGRGRYNRLQDVRHQCLCPGFRSET